jgi:hypothetical protein
LSGFHTRSEGRRPNSIRLLDGKATCANRKSSEEACSSVLKLTEDASASIPGSQLGYSRDIGSWNPSRPHRAEILPANAAMQFTAPPSPHSLFRRDCGCSQPRPSGRRSP